MEKSMKLINAETLGLIAVSEGIQFASKMVSEIAHYKRTIAELEFQRIHMREQAKNIRAQIKAHQQKEVKRIDALSNAFKTCLKQNKQFIVLQKQQQEYVQAQCVMFYKLIKQETDIQQKTELMSMWQQMLKEISKNREEMTRLQHTLMDAYHQFGIDLSSHELQLKDVF